MNEFIPPLEELIERLRLLPGVGRKTATKYAMRLIELTPEKAAEFVNAVVSARTRIKKCSCCFNITEDELCRICTNEERDSSLVCVVEDVRALMSMERVREFRGTYHVLEGTISPMDGRGPERVRIAELLARVDAENSPIREVIIATGSTVDGETTAMYLAKLLEGREGIRITRIAYGIPAGGDLEFADEITLLRAIEGRREIK